MPPAWPYLSPSSGSLAKAASFPPTSAPSLLRPSRVSRGPSRRPVVLLWPSSLWASRPCRNGKGPLRGWGEGGREAPSGNPVGELARKTHLSVSLQHPTVFLGSCTGQVRRVPGRCSSLPPSCSLHSTTPSLPLTSSHPWGPAQNSLPGRQPAPHRTELARQSQAKPGWCLPGEEGRGRTSLLPCTPAGMQCPSREGRQEPFFLEQAGTWARLP